MKFLIFGILVFFSKENVVIFANVWDKPRDSGVYVQLEALLGFFRGVPLTRYHPCEP